jgi:succinate dehydrogenase assembly factor 2
MSTASEPPIDESLLPQPLDRSYETPNVTRARLLYQSRKRGILETDLLLSTFANKHLSRMSEAEMREYDKVDFSTIQG